VSTTESALAAPQRPPVSLVRTRVGKERTNLAAHGQRLVWLTAGMLVVACAMVIGLLGLILVQGAGTFWPRPVVLYGLEDGRVHMGEVTRKDDYRPRPEEVDSLPEGAAARARLLLEAQEGMSQRRLVRTGNFELSGEHFNWVSDFAVAETRFPEWALTVERLTWGRFYGYPVRFLLDGQPAADSASDSWDLYRRHHRESRSRWRERRRLEIDEVGRLNHRVERSRLGVRQKELDLGKARSAYGRDSEGYREARRAYEASVEQFEALEARVQEEYEAIRGRIAALNAENERYTLVLETADGQESSIVLSDIVRAYPANRLTLRQKLVIYLGRWWEFFAADPREANSEGGVFPAIFGTVVMTLLMSLAVVPFGVLAALYLRE